ncbi:unnamed protein product [Moneuplotes crassus]|uniref:Uncharacterized protein n=1 Tax=Euplotes crassus TaxID=5936 RepID=A0AAD2DA88_EUPCR|nr:unnamed protein product [Moneuplotes crassus]
MEQSEPPTKPMHQLLYKLGSFVTIMSYYGYHDEVYFLCRFLCKMTAESIQKYKNMLNLCTEKKTIYIRNKNSFILESELKLNCINMFKFDLELRTFDSLTHFNNLLLDLKAIKEQDERKYKLAVTQGKNPNKLSYVSEDYIHIDKVHNVTLRAKGGVCYNNLPVVSPTTFKVPYRFIPIIMQINSTEVMQKVGFNRHDGNMFNEIVINSYLSQNTPPYNPEIDIAEIKTKYKENSDFFFSLEPFLCNESHESSRIIILDCCEPLEDIEENFCMNAKFQQYLKYFHLHGKYDYVQLFKDICNSEQHFESLREVLVTSKFENDSLIKELYSKDCKKISGHLPSFTRGVIVNEKFSEIMRKQPLHYFDDIEAKFVGLQSTDNFDSFNVITVDQEFEIVTKGERITVSLEKHARFIASKIFTTLSNTIMFKPDLLFEFNTKISSINKERNYEGSGDELFIEVKLKHVHSVDMVLDGSDITSQASMAKLTETFASSNPKTKFRLQIFKFNEGSYSEDLQPFCHIKSLRLIKCHPLVTEIISDENYRVMSELEIFDSPIKFHKFTDKFGKFKLIDTLMVKLLTGNTAIVSFHEGIIPFLAEENLPNLKHLDIFIGMYHGVSGVGEFLSNKAGKKLYMEGYFDMLDAFLKKSSRLRFVKYNDQLDSHEWKSGSRYIDVSEHPKSRFIEIIS